MAITDAEAARQMAEQHPELHESRQIAFGENYLQDLEQGTGTSQYYTGFGLAPDWVTGATGAQAETPIVQEPTPLVQDPTTMIPQTGEGVGITGASAIQPTISDPFLASGAAGGARLPTMDQAGAVAAMTQPEAYSLDKPAMLGDEGLSMDYMLDTPAPNALEQDIAQVAQDTTQAEFDALAPEIGYDVGEVDPKLAEAAGLVDYSAPDIDAMYTDDRIVPEEPFNYTDRIMDPKLMEIQQQNYQNPSFWDTVKNTYSTDGISGVATNFGQSVADAFSGLAEQGIDIGRMAGSAIMNAIAPGLGFVAQSLPQYEPTFEERTLEEELGVTEEGKFSGDPTKSAFAGLNAVSAFGDPVETAKDRIDTRLENIENKNYKTGDKFYDDTMNMIDEYDRVTNELGDIDPTVTTGDAKEAERIEAEERAEAEALAKQEAEVAAQREMQETIARAEAQEAARQAEIDRQNREAAAAAAATQRARDAAATPSGQGAGAGGGSQQATSGGGFSSGWGGGWGWAKGGRVRYSKGGIVDLL